MDLLARLLIVSLFVVTAMRSFITALTTGIQLKKETDSRFRKNFFKFSCYITYFATFFACIAIVAHVDVYKDIAAAYLIWILFIGSVVHANFWKADPDMRMQKLMIFVTNLSLSGGLLLLIVRS